MAQGLVELTLASGLSSVWVNPANIAYLQSAAATQPPTTQIFFTNTVSEHGRATSTHSVVVTGSPADVAQTIAAAMG